MTQIKSEAEKKIVAARFRMLMGDSSGSSNTLGFFGQIAVRLRLVEMPKDSPIKTMGTDGKHLYYDSDFVMSLTDDEVMFVVAHEVLHAVYDHVAKWRLQGRDPMLWNQATDYIINGELVRHGIGSLPDPFYVNGEKCNPCYDKKYDDKWTSELVYAELKKLQKKGQLPNNVVLDTHVHSEGEDGSNGMKPMSPDELSQVEDNLKEAVKEAAREHKIGKNGGTGSSYLERLCDELLEGKVDWRDVLKTQISNCFDRFDYTYCKYNRRNSLLNGVVLPSVFHEGETVKVYVAIDVSGSISNDDVKVFLSELNEITEQFDDFEICIFCFADGVLKKTFKRYVSDSSEDVTEYVPSGTGGTSFKPIYNYLRNEEVIPEQLIIMTDGYSYDGWGDPHYCDTLWLLVNNNGDYGRPTHGVSVYYDNDMVVHADD